MRDFESSSRIFRYFAMALCTALALQQSVAGAEFYANYVPFTEHQLGRVFQQKKLVDRLQIPSTHTKNGITAEVTGNCDLILSGTDGKDKLWQVKDSVTAGGGSIWQADLDGNGQQDLIVVLWTTACGIAPPCKLLLVMFDRNKRPTTFCITGFFTQSTNGIQDLRLLPGTRTATLIEQALASDSTATKNYWQTSAWRALSPKLWRSLPSIENVKLPCYVLYTHKPNHRRSTLSHTVKLDYEQLSTIECISQ